MKLWEDEKLMKRWRPPLAKVFAGRRKLTVSSSYTNIFVNKHIQKPKTVHNVHMYDVD